METRLLILSDTHERLSTLREILQKESGNFDIIVHSGDFSNIFFNRSNPSTEFEAQRKYIETINILKGANKPIVCVAGDNDSEKLFYQLTPETLQIEGVYLLGRDRVTVNGIDFIGLGGSPPVMQGNRVFFPGYPYLTEKDCDDSIPRLLGPQMNDQSCILVTHFPPYDVGLRGFHGISVAAGSESLQSFIAAHKEKIPLIVIGHLHEQYLNQDYNGMTIVNPGTTLEGNYAIALIENHDGLKLKKVTLKDLYD